MMGVHTMETQMVQEGELELEVPRLENYRTSPKEYVPSQTPVFFNPVMEITRDISVSSLEVMSRNLGKLRVCDALAGVGARGLRYAQEIDDTEEVIVNDWSSDAVELIRKNIKINDLSSTKASEDDANVILHEGAGTFDVVDIDPFGSPIPYLDASFSALFREGVLLVTATDTAPLCGAYPKPCLRKYGAWALRTPYAREIGLRILIGAVQRRAASHDLALNPVLGHATQHFFRVHFRGKEGAKRSNQILDKQGYISHCFDCGRRIITEGLISELPRECECGRKLKHAGPMWLEDFSRKKHLEMVIEDLSSRDFELEEKERRLLRLCRGEIGGEPAFYDIHEVSSHAGSSPPKIEKVIKKLGESGYFATRTHFSDTGIRTDASIEELMDIISG